MREYKGVEQTVVITILFESLEPIVSMSFSFKVIRGGQAEPTPPPTKFAQYDQRRAIGDRFVAKFLASRDRAIERERAK